MTFDAPMPPPPPMPPYAPPAPQYATWLYRVGAYLIDVIPAAAIGWFGLLVDGPKTTTVFDSNTGFIVSQSSGGGAFYWLCALGGTVFAIWNVIYRQSKTGQSIGKQVVGIKLVRETTGEPLTWLLLIGRYLLHVLDELPCFLGFLWPLWDDKRQTFADKIVSSVVVRISQ